MWIKVASLLTLLLAPLAAWAQQTDASQFYPRHFVTGVGEPKSQQAGANSLGSTVKSAPQVAKNPHVAARSLGLEGNTVEVLKDDLKSESKPIMEVAETPGLKVKAISLIVGTDKHEHFVQTLQHFNEIMNSRNLQAGTLYMVGPPINPVDMYESGNLLGPLFAHGGLPMALFEAPKKYNIASSPAWIFETEQGDILLEAVPSLEKYLNSRGEFVDPAKHMPVVKAAHRELHAPAPEPRAP